MSTGYCQDVHNGAVGVCEVFTTLLVLWHALPSFMSLFCTAVYMQQKVCTARTGLKPPTAVDKYHSNIHH